MRSAIVFTKQTRVRSQGRIIRGSSISGGGGLRQANAVRGDSTAISKLNATSQLDCCLRPRMKACLHSDLERNARK